MRCRQAGQRARDATKRDESRPGKTVRRTACGAGSVLNTAIDGCQGGSEGRLDVWRELHGYWLKAFRAGIQYSSLVQVGPGPRVKGERDAGRGRSGLAGGGSAAADERLGRSHGNEDWQARVCHCVKRFRDAVGIGRVIQPVDPDAKSYERKTGRADCFCVARPKGFDLDLNAGLRRVLVYEPVSGRLQRGNGHRRRPRDPTRMPARQPAGIVSRVGRGFVRLCRDKLISRWIRTGFPCYGMKRSRACFRSSRWRFRLSLAWR